MLCKADVRYPNGGSKWQCDYTAKYGPYCGVHSPKRKAARRIASIKIERAKVRRHTRLREAAQRLLDALIDEDVKSR